MPAMWCSSVKGTGNLMLLTQRRASCCFRSMPRPTFPTPAGRRRELVLTSRYNVDIDSVPADQRETIRKVLSAKPKPVALGLTGDDRAVVIRGPGQGQRAEFLRDDRGGVTWLRWGGRLHRRVA